MVFGVVGGGQAAADSASTVGDLHVAQTLGDRELTVVLRRVTSVPGPLRVDVVTHAGAAPGTLRLRVAPTDAAGAPTDRQAELRLGAAPGGYSATLRVDRVGPWQVALDDGTRVALISFLVPGTALSPAERATYAGFASAGALLFLALVAAVRARRGWLTLVPAGGVLAALAVAVTGAVLSASLPLPPQPGPQLDPTARNVADPYALSQPLVSDYSRAPVVLALPTAPLTAGQPSDVTLSLTDGATGQPVDDLLVHDSALLHLLVIGPSGRLWHEHPVQVAPGEFQARLTLPAAGHYAVSAELGRRGGGNQLLRSPTGLTVLPGNGSTGQADPVGGLGARRVDGVPVTVDATALAAGRPVTITARIGDTATLQPWLGMVGHLIAVGPLDGDPAVGAAAQTAQVWAHVHSMTATTMAAAATPGGQPDETVAAFGPDVPFTYTFPVAGTYRVWIQAERDYSTLTVPVVLDVPPADGGRP
ncbi:hypothetical protein F0L68_16755 [Solihabitans fulvus]|uniref:Secreted protein n=1 Tax=Solihabitans fulvus TaxID=1892852 RepID=A0A5B2XF53_9PSEU|nr:hypothetical protein F0L68_16755 [Solihabitans fulvus]